jgi:hypothetical protein
MEVKVHAFGEVQNKKKKTQVMHVDNKSMMMHEIN